MEWPEFMKFYVSQILDEIMQEYNLHEYVHNGYIYVRIDKGMYDLPQAGILANLPLKHCLNKFRYYKATHTKGLWKHKTRPIQFVLVDDDFGVGHIRKVHAEHLKSVLPKILYHHHRLDWFSLLQYIITLELS